MPSVAGGSPNTTCPLSVEGFCTMALQEAENWHGQQEPMGHCQHHGAHLLPPEG